MDRIGPDRRLAWKVLSIVLHKLRDRLTVTQMAHFSAQLPLIVRGGFYDQYEPARQPEDYDTAEEFLQEVQKWLTDTRTVGADDAVAAVFAVLNRHISPGEITKLRHALPRGIRSLWPEPEAAVAD
jgi:uncharacterized protein (DUF2267 family)